LEYLLDFSFKLLVDSPEYPDWFCAFLARRNQGSRYSCQAASAILPATTLNVDQVKLLSIVSFVQVIFF
jgi:hypothetical protein